VEGVGGFKLQSPDIPLRGVSTILRVNIIEKGEDN